MSLSPAQRLRGLLEGPDILTMPCCYDALSARLIERGGFPLTFMSGFAVSAARLGVPDAGLISFAEMVDQGRNICQAVSFPVIGDGDTGYGNANEREKNRPRIRERRYGVRDDRRPGMAQTLRPCGGQVRGRFRRSLRPPESRRGCPRRRRRYPDHGAHRRTWYRRSGRRPPPCACL